MNNKDSMAAEMCYFALPFHFLKFKFVFSKMYICILDINCLRDNRTEHGYKRSIVSKDPLLSIVTSLNIRILISLLTRLFALFLFLKNVN